tara:strand:- start:275 stop:1246 length:972 start_codon:yes stop_codon:yes gene_type:complete
MKVLVYIEQRSTKIKANAFETLTKGLELAGSPSNLAAVVVGKGASGLASELEGYGPDKVYVVEGDEFENYNVVSYSAGIEEAIKAFSPNLVLGAASPLGRDVFPRLAARLNSGILTDLVEISLDGDNVKGKKPMYSGKVLANVAIQNSEIQFATIRPNTFAAEKKSEGSATAEILSVSVPTTVNLKTKEIRKGESNKVDLTEAVTIVAGGRAMGNSDNFKILDDCADTIGATVGASRAAVDSGYATHTMQVGQTGKTVNPSLYIACGISGSIQHMAGMRTSKVIVAVNTDPEAPIFGVADYGIVADLFEAVPLMTGKFKELNR